MKKIFVVSLFVYLLSCEEIINEQNITNDTIDLLAPTENVVLKTGTTITFNWEVLNGATEYQLQIATPNFSGAIQIVRDTLLSKNSFVIDSLSVSNYEWRVKGLNSAYETEYTINGFVVED